MTNVDDPPESDLLELELEPSHPPTRPVAKNPNTDTSENGGQAHNGLPPDTGLKPDPPKPSRWHRFNNGYNSRRSQLQNWYNERWHRFQHWYIAQWHRFTGWYNTNTRHKYIFWFSAALIIIGPTAIVVGSLYATGTGPFRITMVMKYTPVVAIDHNEQGGNSDIALFYQNGAGGIERRTKVQGQWSTAEAVKIAKNAMPRKGSPMMALSYSLNSTGEYIWQLFYIDKHDILRDVRHSNVTGEWDEGRLHTFKFKASKSKTAGLTACRSTVYSDPVGIRLYFGSATKNAIQELTWVPLGDKWEESHVFKDSSPNAGCECTIRWTTTTSLFYLSPNGTLKHSFYDFSPSNTTTTPPYPHQQWTLSNLTYSNLTPLSSISAIQTHNPPINTKTIILQTTSNMLQELVIEGPIHAPMIQKVYNVTNEPFMPGTKTACAVLNTTSLESEDLHVWAQQSGDKGCFGIVERVRGFGHDYWGDGGLRVQGCRRR